MHHLLFLLASIALSQSSASAQTFDENFESGIGAWTIEGSAGVWEVGAPTSGPGAAHSGSSCLATVLNGNYTDGRTSRAVGPAFTVPAANQNPRLRFWHWYSFNSSYGTDYGRVQVSADGGATWQDISPQYTNDSSGVWTRASIDLSAYAGQSVRVGFFFSSLASTLNYTSSGWYVDDVTVVTGALPPMPATEDFEPAGASDAWVADFGAWQVGAPKAGVGPGAARSGSSCLATVLNGNYADGRSSRAVSPAFTVPAANQNPRLRFWHWYSFNSSYGTDYGRVQVSADGGATWQDISPQYTNDSSGVWTRASIDLSAYAGQSVRVGFFFSSLASTLNYTSSGWYVDDVTVVTGALPPMPATEDFEPAGASDAWVADFGAWEVGVPKAGVGPGAARSGSSCLATVLNGNYTDGRTSRAVGPAFTVPAANQNPRLRFWHWYSFNSSYGTDYGRVQVSADGGATWQDISPQYTNDSSGVWTRASIDLSAYAGQSVRVGFFFSSLASTLNYTSSGWYVDDVTVVTGALPPMPATEDFEPAGASDAWVADFGAWEVGVPKAGVGPGAARSGSSCLATVLNGNYTDGRTSRAVGPAFTVPAANQNPRLRFWHWYSFNSSYGTDYGRVQVSADGGATWQDISPQYTNDSSGVWTRASIDLSAYAGQSVRVGFFFSSLASTLNYTSSGWYVDDVTVVTGALPPMPATEDFESAGASDAWVADFGAWEVGVPKAGVGPGAARSGSSCLATVLNGNYTDGRTSRAVGPAFTVPAANQNPRLRFWHWYSFNSSYGTDYGRVQVSADGGATWQDISPQYTNDSSGVWTRASIDLSAYAGQSVRVGFFFSSLASTLNYTSSGWYVDDVTVVTGALPPMPATEDFEPAGASDAWVADFGAWEVGVPKAGVGPGAARSGSSCLATVLNGNYTDGRTSRAVGPAFTVPAANQNPRLRFWHWYSFNSSYGTDYGRVQVSADGGATWQDISPQYTNDSSGVWTRASIDLSAYAGQSVRVGFFFSSLASTLNYTSSGWYVDDVTVVTGALPPMPATEDFEPAGASDAWVADFGAWEVGVPKAGVGPGAARSGSSCLATVLNGNYTDGRTSRAVGPAFTVPAANQNPRLRFWHWYSFNSSYGTDYGRVQVSADGGATWQDISPQYTNDSSGVWTRASIDLSAYAGQSVRVGFFFSSLASTLNYTSSGWYVDDVTVVTGALPPMPATEDFEPAGASDAWVADFGAWEVGVPKAGVGPGAARSGSSCLATVLNGNYTDGRTSRAVGPAFTVPAANQNPRLRFWHWYSFNSSYGTDYGRVQVSADGGATWQDISPQYTNDSSGVWTRASIDLSAYAGQSVRVGFFFSSLASTLNYTSSGWYVDDVTVVTGALPPMPATEDFEPAGASDAWVADFGAWEVGVPKAGVGPGAARSGSSCLATVLNGNYTDGRTSRAVGPAFTVPAANQNPRLRFWHWYSFNSSYGTDYGRVQVSADGGATWQDISPQYTNDSSGVWTRASIDLSAYAGQSVRVGFFFSSLASTLNYTSSGWYVDDVTVVTGALPPMPATEDFEPAGASDAWVADFGAWEVGVPKAGVGPGAARSGSSCLATVLNGNYTDGRTSRAVGPAFTVPAANQNPRLRFWHWYSFNSSYGTDYGRVQVSADGGATWQDISPQYTNDSSGVWTRASIDLSAYAGQSVRVGFFFSSLASTLNYTSSGWYVDDVEIQAGTAVLSVTADLEFGNISAGQSAQRSVTITNAGTRDLEIHSIQFPTGFSGNWTAAIIAPGQSRALNVKFQPTRAQSYAASIEVISDATGGSGAIPASGTGTAPAGLLAWWTAANSLHDAVGGHDASLVNGANYGDGVIGSGFALDGSNDYVQAADDPAWAFGTSDFSIELWARFNSVNGRRTLLGSDDGTGATNKWILWLDNGKLIFHLNGSSGYQDIGDIAFAPRLGRWYQLAVTRSGSTYTFYINGEPVGTATNTAAVPDATQPLMIGRAEGGNYFHGALDEIRIYDRALPASEIAGNYEAAAPPAGFFDDFEKYTAGTRPDGWSNSGNSDAGVVTDVKASGAQAARMYGSVGGCWGALLHRPLGVEPPFLIEADFRNGTENLSGCHPFFAGMSLNSGPSWTTAARGLFSCEPNGGAHFVNAATGPQKEETEKIGTYEPLTWHRIAIAYENIDANSIRMTFWLDGVYRGSFEDKAFAYEGDLQYLTISAAEGTAWFDNVRVSRWTGDYGSDPAPIDLNSSTAGSLSAAGDVRIFRVEVPAAGPLTLSVTGPPGSTLGLYATRGSLPTFGNYDARSADPGVANPALLLPNAAAGTWFVMVHAEAMPTSGTFALHISHGTGEALPPVAPDPYGAPGIATLDRLGGTIEFPAMSSASTAIVPPRFNRAGDFTGDGVPDLVKQIQATGALKALRVHGAQMIESVGLHSPLGNRWRLRHVLDWNGDGHGDLLLQHALTHKLLVWLREGSLQESWANITPQMKHRAWQCAAAADADGDGDVDLYWQNKKTGALSLWLMDGTQLARTRRIANPSKKLVLQAAADTNGDGGVDLIFWDKILGGATQWAMSGPESADFLAESSMGGPYPMPEGKFWRPSALADFDGDGDLDMVWQHLASGIAVLTSGERDGTQLNPMPISDPDASYDSAIRNLR